MLGKVVKGVVKLYLLPVRLVWRHGGAELAQRMGDRLFGGVDAATEAPPDPAPGPVEPALRDAADVLRRRSGGEIAQFVDLRRNAQLAATGTVPGSLHIPLVDLPRRSDELDPGDIHYLILDDERSGADAVGFLRERGFARVWLIGGGIEAWRVGGGEVA